MKTILFLAFLATTASAQVWTNEARIISFPVSQSVTNIIEAHEANGSIHTDQQIITVSFRQGQVVTVIDGQEFGWPVRFKFHVSTNTICGPTNTPVKLLSLPPPPPK